MKRWEEKSKHKFKEDEEENDSEKEISFLEKVNNRLYFYSDIEQDKNLQLNKTIREMSGELLSSQKELNLIEPPNIYLHINSGGGCVFSGLSTADEILKSTIPVITIVDGCAASAATLISVVGKKRYINRHAFMLVHQISSYMGWGKHTEFKDETQSLDNIMKIIRGIYKEHTKVPTKKLNEILRHDIWWDAETCLKYGLVDQII